MALSALELTLLCLAAATSDAGAEPAKPKIAVLEMTLTGADANLGKMLTEIIATETARLTGASVVSPSDIVAMIGFEERKQKLGCDSGSECFAELGGALGVDMLLVSDLGLISGTHVINIKLVDIKRSEVLARVYRVVEGDSKQLLGFVRDSMPEVLRTLIPVAAPVAVAASITESGVTAATAPDLWSSPWLKWSAFGLGAATLVTAGSLEIAAWSEHNAAEDAVAVGAASLHPLQALAHAQHASTYSRVALVLAVAGGVATAGAAGWIFMPELFTAQFWAAPVATSDAVGLQLGGGF